MASGTTGEGSLVAGQALVVDGQLLPRVPLEPLSSPATIHIGLPQTVSPLFGRDASLARLRAAVEGGDHLIAVVGPSGAGSSAVARSLCLAVQNRHDLIWWCPAQRHGSVRDVYVDLARRLGLGLLRNEEAQAAALGFLGERRAPLVFLDDVTASSVDVSQLAAVSSVVVTGQAFGGAVLTESLSDLSPDDAAAWARAEIPTVGDEEVADLIAQVGARPRNLHHGIRLRSAGWELPAEPTGPALVAELVTRCVSPDEIGDAVVSVLIRLALADSMWTPRWLVTATRLAVEPTAFNEAIRRLSTSGLIELTFPDQYGCPAIVRQQVLDRLGSLRSYDVVVPRILADVASLANDGSVLRSLDAITDLADTTIAASRNQWADAAPGAVWLEALSSVSALGRSRSLLSVATAAADASARVLSTTPDLRGHAVAANLIEQGHVAHLTGQLVEAAELYQSAADVLSAWNRADRAFRKLAGAYAGFMLAVLGDPDRGLRAAKAGLASLRDDRTQRRERGLLSNNLSLLFAEVGEYAEARAHAIQAVELLSDETGVGRLVQAMAQMNLGMITSQEALFIDDFARRLASSGAAPVNEGRAQAVFRERMGTAEAEYRLALEQFAIIEGPEGGSPSAMGRVNLGSCLLAQGRPAEAIEHIASGIAALERLFGPANPNLITGLLITADAAMTLGRHGESIAAAARAVEIASQSFPALHPVVLRAAQVLQAACALAGERERAQEILHRNGVGVDSAIRGPQP